mmetsp:Transcript_32746/g.82169  ORF Transcript_32746/g.82169 Transcript_32746/m.82169 type:complete len:630 (+) Transcript_32746:109-1998(+)
MDPQADVLVGTCSSSFHHVCDADGGKVRYLSQVLTSVDACGWPNSSKEDCLGAGEGGRVGGLSFKAQASPPAACASPAPASTRLDWGEGGEDGDSLSRSPGGGGDLVGDVESSDGSGGEQERAQPASTRKGGCKAAAGGALKRAVTADSLDAKAKAVVLAHSLEHSVGDACQAGSLPGGSNSNPALACSFDSKRPTRRSSNASNGLAGHNGYPVGKAFKTKSVGASTPNSRRTSRMARTRGSQHHNGVPLHGYGTPNGSARTPKGAAASAASAAAASRDKGAFSPRGQVATFPGTIHLVNDFFQVDSAVQVLRGEHVLGFDMEWQPDFDPDDNHPIALIQLSTQSDCCLFQVSRLGCIPRLVKQILVSSTVLKVGAGLAEDRRKLEFNHDLLLRNTLDISEIAREDLGHSRAGLAALSSLFLGFYLDKRLSTSNWATPELSAAQLMYAATDAWAAREVYLRMQWADVADRDLTTFCELCNIHFPSQLEFNRHAVFACCQCEFHTNSFKSMKDHQDTYQHYQSCDTCQEQFYNNDDVRQHQKQLDHYDFCPYCDRSFFTFNASRSKQQHVLAVHTRTCPACQREFCKRDPVASLRSHIKHKHPYMFNSMYEGESESEDAEFDASDEDDSG